MYGIGIYTIVGAFDLSATWATMTNKVHTNTDRIIIMQTKRMKMYKLENTKNRLKDTLVHSKKVLNRQINFLHNSSHEFP